MRIVRILTFGISVPFLFHLVMIFLVFPLVVQVSHALGLKKESLSRGITDEKIDRMMNLLKKAKRAYEKEIDYYGGYRCYPVKYDQEADVNLTLMGSREMKKNRGFQFCEDCFCSDNDYKIAVYTNIDFDETFHVLTMTSDGTIETVSDDRMDSEKKPAE